MVLERSELDKFTDNKLLIKKIRTIMWKIYLIDKELNSNLNSIFESIDELLIFVKSRQNIESDNEGINIIINKIDNISFDNINIFELISLLELFLYLLSEPKWDNYSLIWWNEFEVRVDKIIEEINKNVFDNVIDNT